MTGKLNGADDAITAKLRRAGPLPTADREAMEGLCWNRHSIPVGNIVYQKGQHVTNVHALLEGWAASYQTLRSGARQITSVLLPGDIFNIDGRMGAIDHNVVALTSLKVVLIAPDTFDATLKYHPQLAYACRWSMLAEVRMMRELMVSLGRRNALQRIAHLFCQLVDRLGKVQTSNSPIHLPLHQAAIADILGLTAVHVNRILQELRRNKLIVFRNQTLTVLDMVKLMAVAEYSSRSNLASSTRLAKDPTAGPLNAGPRLPIPQAC